MINADGGSFIMPKVNNNIKLEYQTVAHEKVNCVKCL